jgi:simple sugar transport system permease protein
MAIEAALLDATARSATPLLLAGAGELVCERAGLLNLGIEGLMLLGAASAFMVAAASGNMALGLAAAAGAAAALALLHGLLIIHAALNQVACGLGFVMVGSGLAAVVGRDATDQLPAGLSLGGIPGLEHIPLVGHSLFGQDPITGFAVLLVVAMALVWRRSKLGLWLHASGDAPQAALAMGIPVRLVRLGAVVFGGAMAGLAGGYLSLIYTPMWQEGMAANRGWIALALVVFSGWRPVPLLLGAFLFGALGKAKEFAQALGIAISPYALDALPYLATIAVLAILSRRRFSAPRTLGKPWPT